MEGLLHRTCFLLLAGGALAGNVFACRCTEPKQISGSYRRAAAVVVARVVSVRPNAAIAGVDAQLEVRQAWKNGVPAKLVVQSGTDCQFLFKDNVEYLIVLLKNGSSYSTARCLGNVPAAEAQPTLEWLRRNGKPASLE